MTTAIIGSGISGLGCAHRLAKAGEPVTIFESADSIGGHTATKRVSVASGDTTSIRALLSTTTGLTPNLLHSWTSLAL